MTEPDVMASDAEHAVADAVGNETAGASATRLDAGTNAVYRVETAAGSYVVKFNTFSEFDAMAAEVQIYRLLSDADLPVPRVVDAVLDPDGGPAYFVMEALPGEPPAAATPSLARQMGACLPEFGSISGDFGGYGRLHYDPDSSPPLSTHSESWRAYVEWYVDHILAKPTDRFRDLVDPIRTAVTDRLDAVPHEPDPAIAYHDFRPANVHVDDAGDLVGVLDLERADLGDVRYTLVETAYLLARHRPDDDAERLRRALYEGFGAEPAEPLRTCYRALAVAREIRGFDFWYDDPNGEDEKAADVRSVADELIE